MTLSGCHITNRDQIETLENVFFKGSPAAKFEVRSAAVHYRGR
jgi:hypothetical protein